MDSVGPDDYGVGRRARIDRAEWQRGHPLISPATQVVRHRGAPRLLGRERDGRQSAAGPAGQLRVHQRPRESFRSRCSSQICPVGTYSPGGTFTSCIPAPPVSFVNAPGATAGHAPRRRLARSRPGPGATQPPHRAPRARSPRRQAPRRMLQRRRARSSAVRGDGLHAVCAAGSFFVRAWRGGFCTPAPASTLCPDAGGDRAHAVSAPGTTFRRLGPRCATDSSVPVDRSARQHHRAGHEQPGRDGGPTSSPAWHDATSSGTATCVSQGIRQRVFAGSAPPPSRARRRMRRTARPRPRSR